MSLIIDIDPVPWKILDLVRARILKNRAKKAKKGVDWSKETLKREMSLQPGPLSRRKRDEPSFISTPSATFVIEGFMERIDYPNGVPYPSFEFPPSYVYLESWFVYRENDEGLPPTYFAGIDFIFPRNSTLSTFATWYENPRNFRSKIYVSFFLTSTGEFVALVTGVSTATAEVAPTNEGPLQTHNKGSALIQGGFSGTVDILSNDSINPLHAWQEKQATPSRRAFLNANPPWVSSQVPCPVDPEYDESRISTIPEYIKTMAFDFTGYPQPSGVMQTQKTTVEVI
jgi:hypothetical protein